GGIDQVCEFLQGSRRPHLVLLGDSSSVFGIDVVDGGEFGCAALGIKARVVFPNVPNTHDSDTQIFHDSLRMEMAKDMAQSGSEPQACIKRKLIGTNFIAGARPRGKRVTPILHSSIISRNMARSQARSSFPVAAQDMMCAL